MKNLLMIAAALLVAENLLGVSSNPLLAQDAKETPPTTPAKTVPQWITQLSKGDISAKREAAAALGKQGAKSPRAIQTLAVQALTKALDDKDPGVRADSTTALGQIGAPAASAAKALVQLTGDGRVFDRTRTVWSAAVQALGAIGKPAVPALIEGLDDENEHVVTGSALALHFVGPPGKAAASILIALAQSENDDHRRSAITALAGLGGAAPEAVEVLTKMLRHKDFHTQYQACRALGKIGSASKPAIPVLIELMKEGLPSVRSNAALALGEIGPVIGEETVPLIAELLDDTTQIPRERAAIALGNLGPFAKSAAPKIREALDKGKIAARCQAALALWKITGEQDSTVKILLAEIRSSQQPWAAAQALRQLHPPAEKVVDELTLGLQEKDVLVRLSCIQALVAYGKDAQSAAPQLRELLKDEDEEIKQAAQAALQKIDVPEKPQR